MDRGDIVFLENTCKNLSDALLSRSTARVCRDLNFELILEDL